MPVDVVNGGQGVGAIPNLLGPHEDVRILRYVGRMGRPLLPNSPLIEVVCELRFAGDMALLYSWGEIQKELREKYPNLLVPASASGAAPLLQPVQLASADGKERVMLAINSFAVSTHAYQGYDEYLRSFESIYQVFARHTAIPAFTRLGMRYVNVLPPAFPSEGVQLGVIHPCLKLRIGGWNGIPGPGREPSQLVFQGSRGPLELRLSLLLQPPEKGHALNFDLDCFELGPIPSTRVATFLNDAHQVVEDAFFAVITDEYHEYLKGNA